MTDIDEGFLAAGRLSGRHEWLEPSTDSTMSTQEVWLSEGTGGLIPPARASQSWLTHVIDDLLDWLNLPGGWDSYEANQISAVAVASAARFLRAIAPFGITRPFVTGDSEGGISISWDSDRYSVQIDFHDSSIDVFLCDKYVDEQWEGPIGPNVERLGPILWYLSHSGV
jgi:hypothetical protein